MFKEHEHKYPYWVDRVDSIKQMPKWSRLILGYAIGWFHIGVILREANISIRWECKSAHQRLKNAPWEFDAIFPDTHDNNTRLHVAQQIQGAPETAFAYHPFQEKLQLVAY